MKNHPTRWILAGIGITIVAAVVVGIIRRATCEDAPAAEDVAPIDTTSRERAAAPLAK
jgi:hypothetical protein